MPCTVYKITNGSNSPYRQGIIINLNIREWFLWQKNILKYVIKNYGNYKKV